MQALSLGRGEWPACPFLSQKNRGSTGPTPSCIAQCLLFGLQLCSSATPRHSRGGRGRGPRSGAQLRPRAALITQRRRRCAEHLMGTIWSSLMLGLLAPRTREEAGAQRG